MLHGNCYEAAAEHFANGLSLVDDYGVLFGTLRDKFSSEMYREIRIQIGEIREMLPIIQNWSPEKCVCN